MGFLRRQVRRAIRKLLEVAYEVPFEDIKRPRMVYGWTGADGVRQPNTRISDSTHMYQPLNIHIEDEVFIGHFTWLDGTSPLTIRKGAQISGRAGIFTHSSHNSIRDASGSEHDLPNTDPPGFIRAPVEIGSYAFIGSGATILPGVTIGERAVVAAGAIVTKSVQPFAIVAGVPARPVGDVREQKSAP